MEISRPLSDFTKKSLGNGILSNRHFSVFYYKASRLFINIGWKKYSKSEQGTLVVVFALEKFRGYVKESPVSVQTDYQTLHWLSTLKYPRGRLAQWALLLQGYDVKIDWPEKWNLVVVSADSCENCSISIELPHRTPSETRSVQLQDTVLAEIIISFEELPKENFVKWTDRSNLLSLGVPYRYFPEKDEDEAQLVVPKQEYEDILKVFHDSPTAGH